MANPGAGTKFVSVNLNKSYGQQQQQQNLYHNHHHSTHHHAASYHRAGRSGGGGGGGGMVVLSRPRSSQKAVGPKLSVPPPLNLPSLRKEHERFDSLGSSGGSAGGTSGSGPRPSSSGVGWTKPANVIGIPEREGLGVVGVHGGDDHVVGDSSSGNDRVVDPGLHSAVVNGVGKGSGSGGGGGGGSVYVPPSARPVGAAPSVPPSSYSVAEKATFLRGEDFPSLQAVLPANSVPEKRQRDGLNQKQKHVLTEEVGHEQRDGFPSSAVVDMHPQFQSRSNAGNGLDDNGRENRSLGGSLMPAKGRKQEEYFPGPLPIVRLNPRSDWADDERDTGHGLTDRGRDHEFSKSEAYWEKDFDFPRPALLPQKPVNHLDRRGQHGNETGKMSSGEVAKMDSHERDFRVSSHEGREGNSRRASSPLPKDGFGLQETGNERNGVTARPSSLNRETARENKYIPAPYRSDSQNDAGRRDMGYGHAARQPWNSTMNLSGSRGPEWNPRERHRSEQYNRHKGDAYQNNSAFKSTFSLGGKGLSVNDPILNFGREKRSIAKSDKHFLEDPFKDFAATGFDGRDPFSGGLIGLVKKKKDAPKQTDFHDPVRESFEAELERVQKMQEQERQRIIEEQERALELARREEEERMRLAREQEERQRRLEEEAREAAWRSEQERLEAMQRAEEQRIAREEEKHRILMEEERRKQAAKQKLLELEERIAKRNAEASKIVTHNSSGISDEKISGMMAGKNASKLADMGDWEESERMVERITTSASSDSSGLNRSFDIGSRHHFSRDGSSAFVDRGKPASSWKRDVFDNGNSSNFLPQDQDNGHRSPRRDGLIGGRTYARKEFYGGPGFMSSRNYYKGGMPDPPMDDFSQSKGQRWNIPGDADHYGRNPDIESEFPENFVERFGDAGWGQSRSCGNPYAPYHERMYQNPEVEELYSFGRSRYPVRQPRVLPPPSMNSMHRSPYRGENPGPSTFPENEIQFNHGARNESSTQTRYDSSHQENTGRAEISDVQRENTQNEVSKLDRNPARCDSQSSVCVSSPPDSPVHLSHDDLDESEDSAVLSAGVGKDVTLLELGHEFVAPTDVEKENMTTGSSILSNDDDEVWTLENDGRLQEQEEYDEDDDGYDEEDEVHDGENENINLTQEFESIHLEAESSSNMTNNLVLGFNEGVEVGMPNDESDKNSRNEETKFGMMQISVGTAEEHGPLGAMCSDGQEFQPADVLNQVSVDNSFRIFQETEKVIQPKNVSQTSAASKRMDHVDASGSSGLSIQSQVPSSSGQNVISNVPSVRGQPEVPLKLQFGLFSGPSLIPSPVPAIQIGSIQMPLHLHPPVAPSLTHMHPSHTPLFQFGQLRYTSPVSQGVLPLAPQPMSYVQPNVSANYAVNQNAGGPVPLQPAQESSAHNLMKSDVLPISRDNQLGLPPRHLDISHGMVSKQGNLLPPRERADNTMKSQESQGDLSHIGDSNVSAESGFQAEDASVKNFKTLSTRELEGQPQARVAASQGVLKEKEMGMSKSQGIISGGRRKNYVFTIKNSSSRSFQASQSSRTDSSSFQKRPRRQRTEFRVRENGENRQSGGLLSSNYHGVDDKSNIGSRGTGAKSGSRRDFVLNRQPKQTSELEGSSSRPVSSQERDSGSKVEKGIGKESLRKNQNVSHAGEDVDAPLQSGVVRVFEQPGIEAPSDDEDFIEVRSKRQMLHDRREQKVKEIKARSRVLKMPRKIHSSQSGTVSVMSNKISPAVGRELSNNVRSDFVARDGHSLLNNEVSVGLNTPVVSQPLAPIGTPAVKTDGQTDLRSQTMNSLQTGSLPVVQGGGKNLVSGLVSDGKNKVLDASVGSWGNSRINQQVMSLMQTQLDEAMKPAQYDSRSSVRDPTISVGEPNLPSASILNKDKSFSSSASPINSLLAGEKIQFGAVTSPTILPSGSRAVSHGIGPPGPCRTDIQISLAAAENNCSLFFDKEKNSNESSGHLEVCEAEAEAAASAVAVAAISSDEVAGNGLGTGPISGGDSQSFGRDDVDGITAGVSGNQQLGSQSRAEESLSVALPADLSVENPPISLWPPLPSPQNSPSQMLSHVPGGPPSHFPFYEMNPMLGRPIFAYGPHDESASTHSQSQKSSTSVSGPPGTWEHHSGVDTFYGPPAGFTGPFISPPGSIPGVQGPPHMVVYNHFAPVGQFGQVGLSFMGTAYVPSGKQPDWKHIPASSAMGVGKGDMTNLNMVSAQRNPTNLPAAMQHLAPGSPLLPMASPLAMFDVSPFQSSTDMPVQAHWSHVPASPLHSVPLSMPLQQQTEGLHPSQFNHGSPADQQLAANRFPESQTSGPSDNNRNLNVPTDATVSQLPDELGLVDSSTSTGAGTSTQSAASKSSSASAIPEAAKTDASSGSNFKSNTQNTGSAVKTQPSHLKNASTQQYTNASGYNYERGGISHRNTRGGEWSHSRMGYQGRNQSTGAEKSFLPSKMKQIYVAKQTSGTSSAS